MAKINLTDVSAGYLSLSTYNANNTALEAAIENTLSRDGTSPNTMSAALDMNSQRIENLPTAVNSSEPVTLGQAATIAGVTTALTQDGVGAVLWPETTAETSAGVTIVNKEYPPGNVLRYGTNTTPGTTDMSVAGQAAIDSSNGAYFPAGDYALDTALTLADDTHIYGDGYGATRLIKNADTTSSHGILYANSGSSSAFVSNLQITDVEIDGLVTAGLFSEHQHLVSLSGVEDVTIERVKFSGPQGDAIYLGSVDAERHNKNVKISNCIFDGVTSENRNAISVIDCDTLVISNNEFYDFTKSTMPGAIDIEPNANAYHVAKNIIITGNSFKSIGGSVGCINFVLTAATYTTQPEHFTITGNTFDTTLDAIVFVNDVTSYTRPLNLAITGNSGKCRKPIVFSGDYMRGVTITGNTFYHTGAITTTFNVTDQLIDATISNNVFTGDDSGAKGLVLRSGSNIVVSGNVFGDQTDYCVLVGGSAAADTFVDGDVTTGTDRVTLTAHTFTDADRVVLSTTGVLPAGLDLFTVTSYYVKSIDVDTVEFYSDVGLTSIVDITAAAGGGTHTVNNVSTLSDVLIIGNTVRSSVAGIELAAGSVMTTTNVSISNNSLTGATTKVEGSTPTDTKIHDNIGVDDSGTSVYGEMTITGNSTATTVSVGDTWYQVVAGWATGDVNGVTFNTDELVSTGSGIYLVNASFSFTGATNDTFSFALAKNDTVEANTLIERKTSTTDVGACALNAVISLAATDTISIWGKNQADVDDFTVTEASLTMTKIG